VTSPIDSATATLYQLSVQVFSVNAAAFEVIRDFRSLKNGGNPFRSMEASQNKSDVTIQFLVGGLVIHFAGISIYLLPFKSYSRISGLCNG
jgi:hypothetical protein